MIRVTIRQEAERRGIRTPYQLAKDLGFKGQSKAARLWKGETLPELETLDYICRKWGCDLSTLVTYVRESTSKKRSSKKRVKAGA